MFKITDGKGFHLTFANGLTLSVQFGRCNYCQNRNITWSEQTANHFLSSENAEIAIWDCCEKYLTKQANKDIYGVDSRNDEKGWISMTDFVKFVNWCEKQKC